MPKPKNARVWNEDLVTGLRARSDQARAQGRQSQYVWRDGAIAIEAVRGDIYCFGNGRIVGLPSNLKVTVDNEVRAIIRGDRPVLPEGWKSLNRHQQQLLLLDQQQQGSTTTMVDYTKDPYLKKIKMRGGAYAILLAFQYSSASVMTKEQICCAAQEYCDEPMEANFHAGRPRGAFSAKNTLVKHGLLLQSTTQQRGGCWTYSITDNGKQFTRAMMDKFNLHEDGLGQRTPPKTQPEAMSNSSTPSASSSTKKARSRTTELQERDTHEFLQWLEHATVQEQKVYQVGQQRRQHLCDVCVQLMKKYSSDGNQLVLEYVTEGQEGTLDCKLFITILQKDESVRDIQQTAASTVRVVSPTSPTKRPASQSNHNQYRFDSSSLSPSPQKKPRAATKAKAAHAAIMEEGAGNKGKSKTTSQSLVNNHQTKKKTSLTDLIQSTKYLLETSSSSSSDSDSDMEDRKPAARPRKLHLGGTSTTITHRDNKVVHSPPPQRAYDYNNNNTQSEVVELLEDSEDEDSGDGKKHNTIQRKSSTKKSTVLGVKGSSDEPVLLLDDSLDDSLDESTDCSPRRPTTTNVNSNGAAYRHASSTTKPTLPSSNLPKLIILIDSRERDRNATPRQMRMDLQRHLTTGLLSRVWPRNHMPEASVEEKCLGCGDFCFAISKNSIVNYRLPIAIERKRVGDLVQRSFKGDHWKQFQSMCCTNNDYATFLIEGDLATANQFVPDGGQNVDGEWNPDLYLIDTHELVYLFMGRAILASHKTRFIQSRDEQGSLRSVGAFGLMMAVEHAATSNKAEPVTVVAGNSHTKLADRLLAGGIPWKLAKRVSQEMGSIANLDRVYSTSSQSARDCLMEPIISNSLPWDSDISSTSAVGWSKAIYYVWSSQLEDPSAARQSFEEHKDLVKDHGALLCLLHSGKAPPIALDKLFDGADDDTASPAPPTARVVHVELPSKLANHCFPGDADEATSFYTLRKLGRAHPMNLELPSIVMTTHGGGLCSSRLVLHILEGSTAVNIVRTAMSNTRDFVLAAHNAAQDLHDRCFSFQMNLEQDKRVLLVHGLHAAIESAAKQAGYQQELLVVVDLVFAAVSIRHSLVVVQAARKKVEDLQRVVQQFALACYHYQLLGNANRLASHHC